MFAFCSANHAENMNNTSPIRSVLINGMCDFENGIGAARRRPHRTPKSTSDCAVLLRSRRTKCGGIMSERYLLCECCKERSDGIAIVTLCVNRVVLSPCYAVAVGSLQGGTVKWARRVKQFVQWTDCSQSEQGGLPRKRRSPNT